jgi:hypothetical protein
MYIINTILNESYFIIIESATQNEFIRISKKVNTLEKVIAFLGHENISRII